MRNVYAAIAIASVAGLASGQVYFSDLEANNGGWAGSGDWQWGMPIGFAGAFASTEPFGGFSGDNVWGTVLGGNHSASTTSSLTQTINVAGFTELSFNFYEWSDSGGNTFDTAKVFVNGVEVYLSDGNSNDAWRLVSLDLSAFDGSASLDINFEFSTTTVVERTGWYVDNIAVSGVPTPASAMLLGLGGLASARRRR
jgi:hypothetical protein